MTLPFAGLARARARMIGGRLEGEAQKWNQDQEEAQRLFREWATRKQLDDTASERQASREWQQNVFTEGQREREQARADQAAWRQQQAEDAKAYRDAQMQENARLQKERLEQQRELAGQQLETRRMLAAIGARAGAQQTPTGRRLTANMADNLGTYNALIGTATDALTKLDAATDAKLNVTGAVRGRITGPVGQFFGVGLDPREISARGALANITSSIMKDRSGGAVTPQEFVRLEPFLPSKNESEESARQKLVDLIGSLDEIRTARLNALEGSGYDVSGVRPHNNEQPTGTVRKYSPHNPYPHP